MIRTKKQREIDRLLRLARQGNKVAIRKLEREHGTKFSQEAG